MQNLGVTTHLVRPFLLLFTTEVVVSSLGVKEEAGHLICHVL